MKILIVSCDVLMALLLILLLIIPPVKPKPPEKKFDAREYLARTKNETLIPVVRAKYGKLIGRICQKEKINRAIGFKAAVEKIIIIESSGNPLAEKTCDGIGLMGVKPEVAKDYKVNPDSLKVPRWNLLAGIRHFNYLVDSLQGDVPAALVAYNCGLKNYRRNYLAVGKSPRKAEYYLKAKALIRPDSEQAAKK